jgi:protein-disulfide isomerase
MFKLRRLQWLCVFLILLADVSGDIVEYRGRLTMDGKPYHGAGQFRFAIVSSSGAVAWSTGNVDLLVREGIYTARLGDPDAGMPPISSDSLGGNPALRIWVRSRAGEWSQAGADVPLKTAATAPAETPANAQMAALLAEVRELRARLDEKQKPAAETIPPKYVTVPIGSSPAFGKADAPLVLVEFTEFGNGASAIYATDIFPGFLKSYVADGRLRIICRQMPQQPTSEPAARAAVAAHEQGKFSEVRAKLTAFGTNLSDETISRAVRDSGLDMAKFQAAFSGKEVAELVQADLRDARALGVSQAPAFVLGRADGDRVSGLLLTGVVPFETWEAELYKLMIAPKAPKKP